MDLRSNLFSKVLFKWRNKMKALKRFYRIILFLKNLNFNVSSDRFEKVSLNDQICYSRAFQRYRILSLHERYRSVKIG